MTCPRAPRITQGHVWAPRSTQEHAGEAGGFPPCMRRSRHKRPAAPSSIQETPSSTQAHQELPGDTVEQPEAPTHKHPETRRSTRHHSGSAQETPWGHPEAPMAPEKAFLCKCEKNTLIFTTKIDAHDRFAQRRAMQHPAFPQPAHRNEHQKPRTAHRQTHSAFTETVRTLKVETVWPICCILNAPCLTEALKGTLTIHGSVFMAALVQPDDRLIIADERTRTGKPNRGRCPNASTRLPDCRLGYYMESYWIVLFLLHPGTFETYETYGIVVFLLHPGTFETYGIMWNSIALCIREIVSVLLPASGTFEAYGIICNSCVSSASGDIWDMVMSWASKCEEEFQMIWKKCDNYVKVQNHIIFISISSHCQILLNLCSHFEGLGPKNPNVRTI